MELMRPSYVRAGAACNGSATHPVYGSVSHLQPTPDFPGLWIAAVPMPRAAFACTCGYTEHAAGRADVHQLATRHQEHAECCAWAERPSGVPEGTNVARGGRIIPRKAKRPGGLIPSRF